MNLLPSISTSVEPDARLMNSGDPPTDLNARTGLSTPPGSSCCAREKSLSERVVFMETTFYRVASPEPRLLVRNRAFCVVDHDDRHDRALALKRQAELFVEGCEEAPAVGVGPLDELH